VEQEGSSGLFEDGFGGGDEGIESGFLVSEGGLLVAEVVFEGSPVFSLLIFGVSVISLGLFKGIVDVVKEVEHVDDVFVVKLGGEFRKTDEEGFEEGGEFIGLLEVFLDLFESGFDLGEGNSVDHVLDELDRFVDVVDGGGVFVIDVNPSGVFSFSLGISGFEGRDGFIVVGGGEVKVDLSLVEEFFVGLDGSLDGGNRFGLGGDLSGEFSGDVVAKGFVGGVVLVGISLSVLDIISNFNNGGLNFIDWEVVVHLEEVKNHGSKLGVFHFSEVGSGVNFGVFFGLGGSANNQGNNAKSGKLSHFLFGTSGF